MLQYASFWCNLIDLKRLYPMVLLRRSLISIFKAKLTWIRFFGEMRHKESVSLILETTKTKTMTSSFLRMKGRNSMLRKYHFKGLPSIGLKSDKPRARMHQSTLTHGSATISTSLNLIMFAEKRIFRSR